MMNNATIRWDHQARRRWAAALLGLAGIWCAGTYAQTANLYSFQTGTGAALDPLSSPTVLVAASNDDGSSTVQNIGFSFSYEGVAYTQYSVNVNGLMRLGSTVVTGAFTNSINAANNQPKIMPFFDDLHTGSVAGGGAVRTTLIGSAPNRTRIVEWFVRWPRLPTTNAANVRFQVWLHESTSQVEFRYGTHTLDGVGTSTSIGIGGVVATNFQSVTTTSHTASNATPNDNILTWPGDGRYYRFTPPCTNPPLAGVTAVNAGCATYDIEVDVTSTGSSPGSVNIYIDNVLVQAGATVAGGPYSFPGYANGSSHTVRIEHISDPNCFTNIPIVSNSGCPTIGLDGCATFVCVDNECVNTSDYNTERFNGTGPFGAIPDNDANGLTFTIPVSGVVGIVNQISLNLNGLTHTWTGDLNVRLTSPGNITHDVFMRVDRLTGDCFASGSPFGLSSDLGGNYTFNDAAATTLWAQPNPVPQGAYRTSTCHSAAATSILATFGLPGFVALNGNWTLTISDHVAGDVGAILGASLDICWSAVACTAIPAGEASPVNAGCATYEIDVEVTDTGDSAGGVVDILIDNTLVASGVGLGTYGPFGPYPNGAHTVTLVHSEGGDCNTELPIESSESCPQTDGCGAPYTCVNNECVQGPAASTMTFAGTGPFGAIPDNDPVGLTFTIPVSGVSGTVTALSLSLTGFAHTWVGDLNARLTSPDNVTHNVFMRVGRATGDCFTSGSPFGLSSGLAGDYSFSDGAVTTLWGQPNPVPVGAYRTSTCNSDAATSLLATFSLPGEVDVNGNWSLTISDHGAGDTGSIAGAGLQVCWVPPCTDLYFAYDQTTNYQDLEWTVYDQNTDLAVESGGINPGQGSVAMCLPNGCYYLVVTNTAGNTITGGYRLVTGDGDRIIDNSNNLNLAALASSGIDDNEGFCLPLGADRAIHTSCDRTWWVAGNFLVASENPAVSAEFGVSNATSGYEFWFYDPNGGYSFRKFRNHATSDGFSPNNAVRACHIQLNNWAVANHLQNNVLYNVRIRGVINGSEQEFGPACRLVLDPVASACPPTGLQDIPDHPNYSCGVSRTFGGANSAANRLYARSVAGANLYEWEFRNDQESYLVYRQTNTVIRHLNWVTEPAMNVGAVYQVRVRASKDGGATWCAWGWTCDVTIAPGVAPGGESFAGLGQTGATIWPNPNNGQQLSIELIDLADDVQTIAVDIHDLSGKRVVAREMAAQHGVINMGLNGDIAAGTYVVTITAGDQRYVERLVITH